MTIHRPAPGRKPAPPPAPPWTRVRRTVNRHGRYRRRADVGQTQIVWTVIGIAAALVACALFGTR